MANFNKFFKTRQTVLEMLRDRKYDTSKYFDENGEYIQLNQELFNENFNINNLQLIVSKLNNPDDKIQVLFHEKKIGIDILKLIISEMNDINITHTLLIVKHKITSFAKKEIIKLSSKYNFEIFLENEMLFNITKHRIVPKHILLDDNEAKAIINCYGKKAFYLPKIFKTDAICKYYDGKVGDIFKIEREKNIYYRVVTRDPKK